MKIAFLSDDFPPVSFGGAGISTFELAQGMFKAGHEVSVITTVRDKKNEGMVMYEGIRVYNIANSYSHRFRFYKNINNHSVLKEIAKILEKEKPDVVHANNIHYYLSYASLKVAKQYAKVVVWTARDTMSVCFGKLGTPNYIKNLDPVTSVRDHINAVGKRYNPFHNILVRKYLNTIDARYSVSDSLGNALMQHGIKNVETVHTGGVQEFKNVESSRVESFNQEHELTDKKVLLFGGRLSEAKGGKKAVEALARIVEKHADAVLLIAGDVDTYAKEMQKYAKKLGVEKNLKFTGWIDRENMNVVYASSDVVLVPSLYLDPFPRITIEGMSAGKPVVGTRYGGTPEIVLDGETGYVIDPFDADEIAEKVGQLFADPQMAKAMGEKGYQRILSSFNRDDKIGEYIVKYEDLLNSI